MGYTERLNGPKIRDDLLYYPDPGDDTRQFIKDPVRRQFFRYNELQIEIAKALDGNRSLADVQAYLSERFEADITTASIERFVARLKAHYLLDVTAYSVDDATTRRRIARRVLRRRVARAAGDDDVIAGALAELEEGDPCAVARRLHALDAADPSHERARQVLHAIRSEFVKTQTMEVSHATLIHAFDPDALVGGVDRALGRYLFSWWGVLFIASLVLSAIPSAVSVLGQSEIGAVGVLDVVVFLVGLQVVNFLHELCHGLACKHYGGRVDDVGWMLIYGVFPANYCDTSDSYLFPQRRAKIVVQLAGSLGTLVILALLFHALAIIDPSFPLWTGLVWLSIVQIVATYSNFIPLVKYDGYYALADYLAIANLRERSFAYVRGTLQRVLLGVPAAGAESTPLERRVFAVYGALASVYTVVFIYGIYISWLMPLAIEHLGTLGLVLSAAYLANLLVRRMLASIARFVAFLVEQRRVVFTVRRTLAFAAAGAAVAGVLAAPWPLQIESTLTVEPQLRVPLRTSEAGIVVEMLVAEGEAVRAGQLVAVLRADALERDRAIAGAELAIASAQLERRRRPRAEEADLSIARTAAARARTTAAAERVGQARVFEGRGIVSEAELAAARASEGRAAGAAMITAAETRLVLAGAREEDLAALEAAQRRWQAQIADLDARIARLQVKSPVAGIVVTRRPHELVGAALAAGEPLIEVHDGARWRLRIVPSRGEPLTGVAVGQRVEAATYGDPAHHVGTTIGEIQPPAGDDERVVVYSVPIAHADWRSGYTGRARIHAPERSVAYRLFVVPVMRLLSFELPAL